VTAFHQRTVEERRSLEEAAGWHQRLKVDPALELSDAFQRWMLSEENQRAWAASEAAVGALQSLATSPELLDLRSRALARARDSSIRRSSFGRMTRWAAVAAVAVAAVGYGAYHYLEQQKNNYVTAVSERRAGVLADGSRISLDAKTKITVRFSDTARNIELDHGRARFDVARDAQRPFTVNAGTESITALGTAFDVEKIGAKVWVTVIQGRVLVKGANPAITQQAPVSLEPGEQFAQAANTRPAVTSANLPAVTGWETGQLIFRDDTLAEATSRVNRYTEHPLTVDPSVASVRVSGVFNAGDVDAFVSAVTGYLPVQALTTSTRNLVLTRRP